ncbi:MAG: flagellar basal body rod C-terminal domain-containing protein, partial [Opitutaceae bacterium]
ALSNTPGGVGNGTIEPATLELSNVDLTNEFASLINAQRSLQASSRIVTVSDTMVDDTINLKR